VVVVNSAEFPTEKSLPAILGKLKIGESVAECRRPLLP
jgi:hypothetical protein